MEHVFQGTKFARHLCSSNDRYQGAFGFCHRLTKIVKLPLKQKTADGHGNVFCYGHHRGIDAMRYGKGVIYVWTIPDNFNDLYHLPPSVLSAIKNYVMSDFPVRIEGPSQVALLAYDNNTFIVESYLPTETKVKVVLTGEFTKLHNLVTGEEISAEAQPQEFGRWRSRERTRGVSFTVNLLPHSYSVFRTEK